MDPVGLAVLVAVLVAATAFGVWRHRTDGRVRLRIPRTAPPVAPPMADQPGSESLADQPGSEPLADQPGSEPLAAPPAEPAAAAQPPGDAAGGLLAVVGDLGSRATLVQLSSAFCAPCRTARVVLSGVAASEAGVRHVEVDAESHLDLVRALGVTRTPTTLVLDAAGHELGRASGVPRRDQLRAVLAAIPALPTSGDSGPRTTG